jgi:hypothetical protein
LGVVLVLASLATFLWLFLENFQNQLSLSIRFFLIMVAYLAIVPLFYFDFHKSNRESYLDVLFNNIVGKKGEDDICRILEKEFDDAYIYFRNYPIPRDFKKGGDIDGVLITPTGLYVLEIKSYDGSFEIKDGYFYKRTKKGLREHSFNYPIWQANKQHEYVTELLNKNANSVCVRQLIVLAHGRILNIRGSTGVYILEKNKLVDFIKKDTATLLRELDDVSLNSIINIFKTNSQ